MPEAAAVFLGSSFFNDSEEARGVCTEVGAAARVFKLPCATPACGMATAVFLSIPVLLIASFAGRGTFKGVPPALLNLLGSGNFRGVPATLNLFGMGSFRGVPATLNFFGMGNFRGVPTALNLFGMGNFRGVPTALNLFGIGNFRGVPAVLNLFGIGSFRGVPATLNLFGMGNFRGVPAVLNLPARGILTDPIPPIFPAHRFFSLGLLPCLFAIPVTLLFLVADECRGGGDTKFLRLKGMPAKSVVMAVRLCSCFPHFPSRRTVPRKGRLKEAEPRPSGRWVISRLGVNGKLGLAVRAAFWRSPVTLFVLGAGAECEGGGETKFLRLKGMPAISVVTAARMCRCFPHFASRRTVPRKGRLKEAEPRPNGRWVTSRLAVKGKRGGGAAAREGGGETKFLRLKVLPAISVVIAAGLCRCFPHFASRRTPRTRLMAACLAAERKWSFRTLFICGVLVMTGSDRLLSLA